MGNVFGKCYWKMSESAETGYPHLLITGYNNSVMSCDDISIDQSLLLFFLHLACDYSYFI